MAKRTGRKGAGRRRRRIPQPIPTPIPICPPDTNPNPNPSASESLLSVSAINLFGLTVSDLVLKIYSPDGADADDPLRPRRAGSNRFLQHQVRNGEACFARIFYFSYEGGLFEMARPTLFLVHGAGAAMDTYSPDDPNHERFRTPPPILRTGLGWQVGSFARDMRVWAYDKGDFSMRLDVDSGPLEQILLASETGNTVPGLGSGAMTRSGSAFTRSGSAFTRSGSAMRRSGDVD